MPNEPRTVAPKTDDHVRWYKRDGRGFTIDVKVEKGPGFRWSWRTLSAVSIELVKLGSEIITAAMEERSHG